MTKRGIERVRAPRGDRPMEISNEKAGPGAELFAALEGLDVERAALGWPGAGALDPDEPALLATTWPVFDELEMDDVARLA